MMNAIPWYQSPLFISAIVSLVFQLGAVVGYSDKLPVREDLEGLLTTVMQVIAIIAGALVPVFRAKSSIQPLAATQASADKKNQGGFVRPLVLGILLAIGAVGVLATSACQSLGVPQATSMPDRFAAAELGLNGSMASVAKLLNGGVVKAAEGKAFRELAVNAHEILGAGEAAFQAGDIANAEDRLAVAESVLKSLRAFVASQGGAT